MSSAPIARQEAGNDPYHWLENRDSEEVLAYLQAENAYLETVLEPQQALREQGYTPAGESAAQFGKLIAADIARYAAVTAQLGLRVD